MRGPVGRAGQAHGLAQHADVANVVGQNENQARIGTLALFVAEVAVHVDQRFVKVVAGREVAKVAAARFLEIGRQDERLRF